MPNELPARIGPYPIRGLIGTGSMGVVYLGHDPVIDRPVAIKTIQRRLLEAASQEQDAAARFRIEAQAAGRLNHRNIVSVYQFGEDADCAYIVMEYVAGHSLRDYLKRPERFTQAEVMCVMVQLLDALHFAHERGVVHRDVKPANLIVADDGRLKISDFGIARTESSQMTRANAVMGSPGYIAPEQYTGGVQDHRVDVFAAGVLLYQLLTGTLPFSGTDESIMYQIVYEPLQSLALRAGDPALAIYEPILGRALAKDPAQRYLSAKSFEEALRVLAREPVAELFPSQRLMPMRGREPAAPSPGRSSGLGQDGGVPARQGGSGSGTGTGSGGSGKGSNPSVPVPTGWDEATLQGLERELARFVGPVARVLVRRAARGQTDLAVVRRSVAEAIGDFDQRERFMTARREPGTGDPEPRSGPRSAFPNTRPPTQLDGPRLLPEDVERAAAVLTEVLGPIARIMAKQCAAKASTREQFVARLLEQLAPGIDAKTVQTKLWRVFR